MEHFGHEEYMAMLLRCTVRDGKIVEASVVPGYLKGHGPPDYNPSPDSKRTAAHLRQVSSALGTAMEERDGCLYIHF
jgi:hypothetical protein